MVRNAGWAVSRAADCTLMTMEMESGEDGRVSAEPPYTDGDGSGGGGGDSQRAANRAADCRSSQSKTSFKQALKTHLFSTHY